MIELKNCFEFRENAVHLVKRMNKSHLLLGSIKLPWI